MKKLQGAVLMIGSLYWENEELAVKKEQGKKRDEWRNGKLDMPRAIKVKAPIRYGRKSGQRFHTYTMLFSASVPKYGEAFLVPYQHSVSIGDDLSELFQQAHELADVEGISGKKKKTVIKPWGMVALTLTAQLKQKDPDLYHVLKLRWKTIYDETVNSDFYKIAPEGSIITPDGILETELAIPDEFKVDYILSTPVVSEEHRYPDSFQIAEAMKQAKDPYYTYFLENVKSGIITFQDHEIMKCIPIEKRVSLKLSVVHLKDYKQGLGVADQFQKDLQFAMGDKLFRDSKAKLFCDACKCMGVTIPESDSEKELLARAAEMLNAFEKKFGRWDTALEHAEFNSLDFFLYYFLNLSKLPLPEYLRISALVSADLKKRNDLILYYESLDSVREYKKSNKRHGSLKDNLEIDFYLRNTEERNKIENYFNNELKDRVLNKCSGNSFVNRETERYFGWYLDRPFISSYPRSDIHFDHRRIDCFGHRLLLVEYEERNDLERLYVDQKEEFYKGLFSKASPSEIWGFIHFWLNYLPSSVKQRQEIFKELEFLFEAKQWYAFFALALIQTEGLFTDWASLTNKEMNPFATLPKKVQEMRPRYEVEFIFYDYCQFEVAQKRNRFLHRGLFDNIQINAYDSFIDLWYLLQLIAKHDDPFLELNRIIQSREFDIFLSHNGYNRYFDLLEQLTQEQRAELKEQIKDFEVRILSGHVDLECLAQEMEEFIPKTIEHWYATLAIFLGEFPQLQNIKMMSTEDIQRKKSELQKFGKAFIENHVDISKEIFSYRDFLERYERHLPNISDEVNNVFSLLMKKYKDTFDKIELITLILSSNY